MYSRSFSVNNPLLINHLFPLAEKDDNIVIFRSSHGYLSIVSYDASVKGHMGLRLYKEKTNNPESISFGVRGVAVGLLVLIAVTILLVVIIRSLL